MSCSLKIQGDTSLTRSWGASLVKSGGLVLKIFFFEEITHYISKDAKFDAGHFL